ncbi:Protein of unknown function [Bacillus cytotoxicus]|jgi:hypothetical protein
MKEDS